MNKITVKIKSLWTETLMNKFVVNELMNFLEAFVEAVMNELYSKLMEQDFALDDPEGVILTAA